jgi:hypothetical protein
MRDSKHGAPAPLGRLSLRVAGGKLSRQSVTNVRHDVGRLLVGNGRRPVRAHDGLDLLCQLLNADSGNVRFAALGTSQRVSMLLTSRCSSLAQFVQIAWSIGPVPCSDLSEHCIAQSDLRLCAALPHMPPIARSLRPCHTPKAPKATLDEVRSSSQNGTLVASQIEEATKLGESVFSFLDKGLALGGGTPLGILLLSTNNSGLRGKPLRPFCFLARIRLPAHLPSDRMQAFTAALKSVQPVGEPCSV